MATAIYLFFDNWVLLGLYLKTESKSVIIGFDNEEGVLLVSSAGMFKWATITLITFSSINFLKGYSSRESKRFLFALITGNP